MSKKYLLHILLTLLVTACVSSYSMFRYVSGPLNGDFSKHIMSAKRWGIPDELKEKGIAPLYTTEHDAGWDGQFHYYMSNDLLAQKDTSKHVDADAYRYQRIGLPLFAKLLSLATFQDWVSTETYYASSFLLVLSAVLVGGIFFAQNNSTPLWILPWALSAGTQLTLLNGLPDAAADAFFIMALVACFSRRYWLYGILISFAALSREAYILFPLIFFAGMMWVQLKSKEYRFRLFDWLLCALPIVLFGCWHLFIRFHFDQTPGSQASRILGFPLLSTLKHLIQGLSGHYPGMPEGNHSRLHGANIVFYLMLILSTLVAAVKFSPLKKLAMTSLLQTTLSLYLTLLIGLYLFFGDTVMWHFSGYMKAASIFLFLWPFFTLITGGKIGKQIAILLVFVTVFFGKQAWDFRVKQPAIVSIDQNAKCSDKDVNEKKCARTLVILAKNLPATLGEIVNEERLATSKDGTGFLAFGPYLKVDSGRYRFKLSYSGRAEQTDKTLAYWEIGRFAPIESVNALHKADLTSGNNTSAEAIVQIPETGLESLEIRVWFNGSGTMKIKQIEIEKLD